VVRTWHRVWTQAGAPDACVCEGGSWQAGRTLEFLNAAGVRWHDAKGRPRSKLIENYFNDLWTVLSLESDGQIGRYRSEMERENDILTRCRAGTLDPRRVFPMLQDGLNAIQRAVDFKKAKDVHSDIYGSWVPMEQHQAGMAARPLPALAPGLEFLAARERHERVVRNFGQITARAMSPLGDSHPYSFAGDALTAWNGARVWVHFDPFAAPVVATVTLAKRFRDTPAGTVIARDLRCLTDAPELIRDSRGWRIEFAEGLAEALAGKPLSAATTQPYGCSIKYKSPA
jgi:hypothetical protein